MKNKYWYEDSLTFHETLLHELDEWLDYWQEKLITAKDTEWVQRKINGVKISIQKYYYDLEQLKNT